MRSDVPHSAVCGPRWTSQTTQSLVRPWLRWVNLLAGAGVTFVGEFGAIGCACMCGGRICRAQWHTPHGTTTADEWEWACTFPTQRLSIFSHSPGSLVCWLNRLTHTHTCTGTHCHQVWPSCLRADHFPSITAASLFQTDHNRLPPILPSYKCLSTEHSYHFMTT